MQAFIGLGSNVGDRARHIHEAVRRLGAAEGIERTTLSPLFETSPVGGPTQGWYVNAVVALEGTLAARALLEACLRIEHEMGRVRTVRNAPREIDLDVLLVDDLVVDEPGLVVPHPALHARRFVLEPLVALDPDRLHPRLGATVRELLGRLDEDGADDIVRPFSP